MKNDFSRRQFLQSSAVAAGGLLAANTILLDADPLGAQTKPVAPSDRVRFGMIGIGMQGSGLLTNAITLPGVECVGAADLYDGRHTLAREITNNPSLPASRRYHDLLDRKDIDCIVAAVPDHWHKRVVVDACNAGKDIYCEKPMSHTIPDGFAMVEAAQRNNRIVQIGSQRVSSNLAAKAREMYHNGAIGDIEMVELTLGRNDPTGAWEYPPPFDLSPQTLDWDTWLNDAPKIPFNKYHFARWRCWKEYGTGVAGDLLVHLISGMQFSLGINEVPKRVSAFGGIYRWKDGRNMPDVHAALFEYKGIPVYMRLSLDCESAEVTRFEGSKGMIELREFSVTYSPQAGVDTSPSYYSGGFPGAMRAAYVKKWHEEHDPAPGREPAAESITINGNDYDDLRPHLWNFFEAVRSRKPVVQDAIFGHNAALACHLANESYFRGVPVRWDEASQTIKSLA